jgi:hypothetical protein
VFAESEARIQSQLGDISALSHCISFRPALDELCALGEAGIAHTLYAWTATRLTRELARVEAAALVLPAGPERRTAMLAALSHGASRVWNFRQTLHVVQRLYRRATELWHQRDLLNDAEAMRLSTALDQMMHFSVGDDTGQPFLPMLRAMALSLAASEEPDVDGTLWHLRQHASNIAPVHAHLLANHRDDPNPADRWGLWPVVTDGGTDVTHAVVVIVRDDDDLDGLYAPPPSEENEDEYYDCLGAAAAAETRAPSVVLIDYRGNDLQEYDDWEPAEDAARRDRDYFDDYDRDDYYQGSDDGC